MVGDEDQITGEVISDGADAICPAAHRYGGRATEPPCGNCYALAETVLRGSRRRLVEETGGRLNDPDAVDAGIDVAEPAMTPTAAPLAEPPAALGVKVRYTVPHPTSDDLWKLYEAAFREVNAFAVQRHLMHREEFNEVMADARVGKYISRGPDGTFDGLSTFTNDLDAVPLISPEYFARRWPQHYAEKRIWYVGFVAVHPDREGHGVFGRLVEAMYRPIVDQDAVVGLDMCRFNTDARRLGHVTTLLLGRITGRQVPTEVMDEQSYWLYDLSRRDLP
jgi:hypothetical protein